jgi:isopentenyl-diphosphate delta-isomerase
MSDKTSERKANHIDLAFKSQVTQLDDRFNYEPLLAAHPSDLEGKPFQFVRKIMHNPLWVSSMTGGTGKAGEINVNLAKAVGKYGMGMGLGSCRIILDDDTYLADFQLRKHIGDDHPFYANLGIAQLEELIEQDGLYKINELIDKTETDGLIIHVNPFQEWLQPEGDHFKHSPLDTIKQVIDRTDCSIIVKEVGQGMGKQSLKALFDLPIDGIDFGAHGGTNFSALELFRANLELQNHYAGLTFIGHSANEMVDFCNELIAKNESYASKDVIISGGVKDFLDGYYFNSKLKVNSVYAQASAMLRHAEVSYHKLDEFIEKQLDGYRLATRFLTLKETT